MTEEPTEGGVSFPEAAQRYGARDLFEAYRIARQQRAAYRPPGSRVRHRGYLSPGGAIGYQRDIEDCQADLNARAARWLAPEAAERDAWRALLRDMIERLARRELIAFGTIYRPGSLIPDRVEIRPERWSRFRFVSGNAIRFGPRDRSTVVDKVLIYRASAEVPPPAPGDKAPYGAKKRLLVALIGKHRMTLAGMETRKERAAWLRPKAKCSESTAIQILKEEGL